MASDRFAFSDDPFVELGVPSTATLDEVKRAFRRRARETHPDHQPDDPHAARQFARLRAAYEAAVERVKGGPRERTPRGRSERAGEPKRGRGISEHELAVRVHGLRDEGALRRVFARHGHRPLIGVALARNPAFPTDALAALRRSSEAHWTVDAAIADRADVPYEVLAGIARLAREPVVGQAVAANASTDATILDALVSGPIRLDPALERALAAHPELSICAAARLAGRHATHIGAVLRLLDRGDLPEELVTRLAAQTTRPQVAAAARNDLQRRGLPVPPPRNAPRPPKAAAGYW